MCFLEEYISFLVLYPRMDLEIQSESPIEELAFQCFQNLWVVGVFLIY